MKNKNKYSPRRRPRNRLWTAFAREWRATCSIPSRRRTNRCDRCAENSSALRSWIDRCVPASRAVCPEKKIQTPIDVKSESQWRRDDSIINSFLMIQGRSAITDILKHGKYIKPDTAITISIANERQL